MNSLINLKPIVRLDGEMSYLANFMESNEANGVFSILFRELDWKSDVVKIYGKTHHTRRQVVWMGDSVASYKYSGQLKIPTLWHPQVLEIKLKLEKMLGIEFNACLLNMYPDGSTGMGWHSDDEKELGKTSCIASVSLGCERYFDAKHKSKEIKHRVLLENGSLLLMKGNMQTHWKHALPVSKKVKGPRINLTFRKVFV
jgi:alkylated DNA repair dioxygenase AlkB